MKKKRNKKKTEIKLFDFNKQIFYYVAFFYKRKSEEKFNILKALK